MEAVGVLLCQDRQEQQQCRLGVWVEQREGLMKDLFLRPYWLRLTEPCSPHSPLPLATTISLTWWDPVVWQDQAADAQEL